MPPLRAAILVIALGLAPDGDAARQIALRVDPPQPVTAITLRSGEALLSVGVRDGKFEAPTDLPLPWTVGLTRFEATTYTREDLDAGRPLLLREHLQLRDTGAESGEDQAQDEVELRRRNLRLSRSAQAERISGAQSPLPATAGRGLG